MSPAGVNLTMPHVRIQAKREALAKLSSGLMSGQAGGLGEGDGGELKCAGRVRLRHNLRHNSAASEGTRLVTY